MDGNSDNDSLNKGLADLNADMLHAVMELVSDGIWDWNANTGFVYRNPGWYEMLGYPRHSLENSVFTWENVIHPEDYPPGDGPVRRLRQPSRHPLPSRIPLPKTGR